MMQASLAAAADRSIRYFRRSQHPPGYWVGELESNATITAEYLFFRRILDRVDPEREQAIVRQLLALQSNGGWSLFYGGPPELNTTIEASVALELAGLPLDHPALVRAAEVVRDLGGLAWARVFTRIWLALLGALPWDLAPAMPPELILLPDAFPLSIYRFASWARSTIVPLLIVLSNPPRYHGPTPTIDQFQNGHRPAPFDEVPLLSRRALFVTLDQALKGMDDLLQRNPLRPRALEQARRWILERQEYDGGWAGIIPAMVNSTLALHALNNGDHDSIERGIQAVEGFGIVENGMFRLQSCVSPGWDTPWTMLALREAGLPADDPSLVRAAHWLLDQQSTVHGDWSVWAPGVQPGGWPFEFANCHYPDTDDTALVLQVLPRVDVASDSACRSGLSWLLGMQNKDGGWAAFDRQNDTELVEQIPFCDFGEVLDPSSVDVTAHVLELLAGLGFSHSHPAVRRGLAYIWREQEADGAWFGRWGVNYVYGTAAALMALGALGFDSGDDRVALATQWLRRCQNDDGGWGESCLSYTDPSWRGTGPSTASQTAWAVLGLLTVSNPSDASIRAGLTWLLDRQSADGTWLEPHFTGTGFPGDFYIKYHEYRNYFPLLALARAVRQGETEIGGD
jgi:squalene-hopene/tetraprenyl-beta-curcumene cyclase